MSEHTPGPWEVFNFSKMGRRFVTVRSGNMEVADVTSFVGPYSARDEERADANARLIAAAPQLLKACKAFVAAYEKSLQLEKTDMAVRMARIAIEAAEGES